MKYGKQIIIEGKDYVNNSENKFRVTVLGAVAELERAKIIERTTRGQLHRLRMGEMSSNGHRLYGYVFVKKTPTAPAALVINKEQAGGRPVDLRDVREWPLRTCHHLALPRRAPCPDPHGSAAVERDQIKSMLQNETYAGTRYFNRITAATEASREGKQVIRGRWVYRDRSG